MIKMNADQTRSAHDALDRVENAIIELHRARIDMENSGARKRFLNGYADVCGRVEGVAMVLRDALEEADEK